MLRPARRRPLGRAAAAAGDRPRAGARAEAADPRRADRRHPAQHRARDRRHHPAAQPRSRASPCCWSSRSCRSRGASPASSASSRRAAASPAARSTSSPTTSCASTSACERATAVHGRRASARRRRMRPRGRGRAPDGRADRRPRPTAAASSPAPRDEPAAAADAGESRARRVGLHVELRRRTRGWRSISLWTSRSAPGAAAFLSTQASTKVYRSRAGHERRAARACRARTGCWSSRPIRSSALPASRYRQVAAFDLAAGGGLVLVDWMSSGRLRSGERWAFDEYVGAAAGRVDGRLVCTMRSRCGPMAPAGSVWGGSMCWRRR